MQERCGALDPVVQPDTESVNGVGVLQRTMELHGEIMRRPGLRPFLECARPHVVTPSCARCEYQNSHGRPEYTEPPPNYKPRSGLLKTATNMTPAPPLLRDRAGERRGCVSLVKVREFSQAQYVVKGICFSWEGLTQPRSEPDHKILFLKFLSEKDNSHEK